MLILTNSANIDNILILSKLFNIYFNSINNRLICFAIFYKLYIFAEEKTKIMQKVVYHRLEEFRELIWDDYISEYVVSNKYISDNDPFLSEIVYDMHRLHQKSNGDLTIQVAARMIESFLLNSFRYKPSQEDKDNVIDFSEE